MSGRTRWFGATGRRVPEIALEGSLEVEGALDLAGLDAAALRDAHGRGVPVLAHAATAAEVRAALAHPEVSCVLVRDPALLELDLADLTYG
ncbi:hypothetical protein Gocc_2265 [Gaiella occulta]|uniref:Uncharacterized protein n=1 Tax=Gaiella occulta TaxID=1002870 RepID=A0A7M2YXG6_9ACTN|nr:hypothetical protein [Gaiella occulta]RDI74168.1 hypothetical protein Gocc_2265 [Gaiella occulta]